jgi:hypothetical protein
MDWGNLAGAIGKSFATSGKNADGSSNPYAGIGQSAMQGVFGMMQAKGQSDDQKKMMAAQQANAGQDRISSLQQSIMGDTLTRDKMYADRNPLGSQQQYMQQQMLRDIMLQKMMGGPQIQPINSKVQEKLNASGWKPFTPQLRSGWEEGPSMFGKEMSLNALGQGDQVNALLTGGRAPQTNFSRIYGDNAQTQAMQNEAANYNDYATQQRQAGPEKWLQDAIDGQKAQQAAEQQKKQGGGNIFGKILKGIGAGASFIPGIGQIVAPIATAAGGLINGEGWKKSLGNAALSAIPMGLGKLGGAIGGTAGSILGKVANPMGLGGKAANPVQNAIQGGMKGVSTMFQPQGGGFAGGGLPQAPQQQPQFQNQFAQQPGGFKPVNPRFGG